MPPSTAPTHGVQPAAKAAPNTAEVRYRERKRERTLSLYSRFRNGILIRPVKYKPNKIINTPPTRENQICASKATRESSVLSSTPITANTSPNPSTKNTLFKKISRCLDL